MGSNCLRDEGLLIEPIIFKPGQPVYSRIGVIDRMGLRDSVDAAYALHQLAHAHNALTSEDHLAGQNAKTMKEK